MRANIDKIIRFGVKRIGISGSAVPKELQEDSNIEFVVEFEKGKLTFKNFGGFVMFLEKLFNKEVDVLTSAGIESIRIKSVKEQIKKEVEHVS